MLALLPILAAPVAAQTLILEGEVTPGTDHERVEFEVPAGIAEIEVRHESVTEGNFLDWGVDDPAGFRGWGGGNPEPAVIGIDAASRSYVPGPIPEGTWAVIVGKPVLEAAPYAYRLEIDLRTTPTLAPQSRAPFAPPAPLEQGRRWYAGDFHVHSIESGDARASLDGIARLARERGLDFVVVTDHNTSTGSDFLGEAQARYPDLLLIPGIELTTYGGHANALGITRPLDYRLGIDDASVAGAIADTHAWGGLFSINHPALDLGSFCRGCAWEHEVDLATVDAVEIQTGGLEPVGGLFSEAAIAFWDAACAEGHHIAAIGGSDDHRAGVDLSFQESPIGDPTTLVEADALSVEGILAGVREGRTVVKLQGPEDPMVELAGAEGAGDTRTGQALTVTVTGGVGDRVRFVVDGVPEPAVPVVVDPFTAEHRPGPGPERRVRAELMRDGAPRVVTSHVWFTPVEAEAEPGCGCATRRPWWAPTALGRR